MDSYIDPDRPKKYSYHCVNGSIVDKYLLRHWWPVAIKAIPPRMPANVVSVVGNLGSYFAFLILCGALFGPVQGAAKDRPWIFGLVALGLFFYQTLDALDGIQARRTGAAGPLGEFVDHWFDSFNVFLLPLGFALAFPSVPMPFVAGCTLVFAACDWLMLKSVATTNTLVLETLSTEEGQVIAQLFYLSLWAFGYDFWAAPVLFGLPPAAIGYAVLVFGVGVAGIRCIPTAGGLSHLALELASLAPFVAWTVLELPRLGSTALLLGGLLVGFNGSRFSGELLRERLLGAAYAPLRKDLLVIGPALLALAVVPGIPAGVSLWGAVAALAWSLAALAAQLSKSIARVREVLGTGFLGKPVKGRA